MQVEAEKSAVTQLQNWRQFLALSTLWLGVLLLGSGVICWVAANWSGLSKVQRFGGAQILLALVCLASAWLGLRLRAASGARQQIPGALLALAGLMLGALLALLGQTYQTGADTWELFAWWMLLLLPWALVSASQPVWLLWLLVLNTALVLWLHEFTVAWRQWDVMLTGFPTLVLAGVNLLLLAGWERAVRYRGASALIGPRALVLWVMGALVTTVVLGDSVARGMGPFNWLAWLATTLVLGFYYLRVRRDLLILAILAGGGICASLRLLGGWLAKIAPTALSLLILTTLLLAGTAYAAQWLRRLAAQDAAPDTLAAAPGHTPWFVQILLALSAWLATLLLLPLLFFAELVQSAETAGICGVIFCLAGVAVLRSAARPFWRQCASAIAFTGQVLIILFATQTMPFTGACLTVLLASALVYTLAPEAILRFLSGGVIALALSGLILRMTANSTGLFNDHYFDEAWNLFDEAGGLYMWLPVAVAGAWASAAAFLLARRRAPILQPLAWAYALTMQSLVWLAGGVALSQVPALWPIHPVVVLFAIAGAFLPAVAALVVLQPLRAQLNTSLVWGVPLGLLALALFWLPSIGVAFALTWLLLGFALRQKVLAGFGILGLLAYLLSYYYQLQIPLLDKAIWLCGAAALLLFMRALIWLVPRMAGTQPAEASAAAAPPVPEALRVRTLVVLSGLALALVAVNHTIWRYENLLAGGQSLVLELAPVDPRSLMQGDYMALRFVASRQIEDLLYAQSGQQADELAAEFQHGRDADGYAVLRPDEHGVAQVLRIQPEPQPLDADELALRYRNRRTGIKLVTNAYFFPEGLAQRYEAARYGEVKVDAQGRGLLLRLLDQDRQPL